LKGIGREGREKEQDLGEDEGALEGKGRAEATTKRTVILLFCKWTVGFS